MSFFLIFRIFNFSVGLESPQLDLSSSAYSRGESVSIRSCVYVHTWYGNICSTHLRGNKNQNFQDSPWFGICTACCLRRPPVRRTTVRATTLFANSFPTSRPSACSGSRMSRTPLPWLKPPSASFHWTPAKMMISIIIIASRYRSSRPAKRQNYKGRKEEKKPAKLHYPLVMDLYCTGTIQTFDATYRSTYYYYYSIIIVTRTENDDASWCWIASFRTGSCSPCARAICFPGDWPKRTECVCCACVCVCLCACVCVYLCACVCVCARVHDVDNCDGGVGGGGSKENRRRSQLPKSW